MTADNGPDDRNEDPPEFDLWEEPEALITAQPIRERMLDVV